MSALEHSSVNRARGDLVEYLKSGVLGTRWPNGSLLNGVTSRTAELIAEHLADGPLQLRVDPPNPHDSEEQLRPYLGRLYDVETAAVETIDRDALLRLLGDVMHAEVADSERRDAADRVLALLRPVNGVTLTRDEADTVLRWKRAYDHQYGRDHADDGLDERLGAAQ